MNESGKPLYQQIVTSLKQDIERKKYSPGHLLPTEDELTRTFDASRTTIRSAIGVLEKEGYVFRKQGKGTIVKDPKSAQNLNYLSSFTDSLLERGITVETGILSIRTINPPQKVAQELNISDAEKVCWIQRTRIADNIPIAIVNNYLLARTVPGLEGLSDSLRYNGLYQVLETEYGLKLHSAVDTITVYLSGPLEEEMLQLTEPTPLFLNRRTTWLEDGTPFEHVISMIRGDMHQYKVYLESRKNK